MLNGYEIVLIFALALLLFGAKKLPELAKGLGQGMREFKKATREASDQIERAIETEPAPTKHLPEPTAPAEAAAQPESKPAA